jgi:hypothetical protein
MNEISIKFHGKTIPIEIQKTNNDYFFMIDTVKALVPPHFDNRNLLDNAVFTFFIELTGTIALGIVSNYLYSLIKKREIKEIKINGKKIEITNENISIKIIEGELSVKNGERNH